MVRIIIAYLATLAVFAAIDAVWLTHAADLLYRPVIGSLLAPEPRIAPAIIFYLLYIVGLVYFAVMPGLAGGGWRAALLKGALFGLFAYATYDLTNQATLAIWSTRITIIDMIWGTFVSGSGAAGGYAVTRFFTRR